MITIDLKDKTILMTGSLGGIAEYVIAALSQAGATLILTDKRSPDEARPILHARELSVDSYFSMDVTKALNVQNTVQTIFRQWPGINIVLGHAGGTGISNFLETSPDQFLDWSI